MVSLAVQEVFSKCWFPNLSFSLTFPLMQTVSWTCPLVRLFRCHCQILTLRVRYESPGLLSYCIDNVTLPLTWCALDQ